MSPHKSLVETGFSHLFAFNASCTLPLSYDVSATPNKLFSRSKQYQLKTHFESEEVDFDAAGAACDVEELELESFDGVEAEAAPASELPPLFEADSPF